MSILNPTQLFQLLKNGNPKEVALQLIQNNFPNDPLAQSLLSMGLSGNQKDLEEFATNYFNQQGKDFQTELDAFINEIKSSQ